MNAEALELLAQAVERVRPLLMGANKSTKQRVHLLWSAAKAARGLAATDVTHSAFTTLAVEVGLIDRAGRWGADVRDYVRPHGAEDIAHVVTWALRGWNPFEKGPLK